MLALLLAATPMTIRHYPDGSYAITAAAAFAKDGADDGGGGTDDGGGDDSSSSGKDDNGGDRDDTVSGNGDDSGGNDDSGKGGQAGDSQPDHEVGVEVHGDEIRLRYADGFVETFEGGQLELADPQGRIVIRRSITQRDLARLRLLGLVPN